MRLSELHKKAVEVGIKYDPRDGGAAEADLERVNKDYESLSGEEKEWFDQEALWNPYLDSRVICGDEDGKDPEFHRILASLDVPGMGGIEIAKREKADLIVSHHPAGRAAAGLHRVLSMQVGIWKKFGVRLDPVDDLARETSIRRLYDLAQRESRESNLSDVTEELPDILRYFGLPAISFHTVADNCATTYLQRRVEERQPTTLQDVLGMLREIPEYQQAIREFIGPRIVVGRSKNKSGGLVVDMTGGEEAPEEIFSSFADSGIKTMLCMHVSSGWYEAAAEHGIQVVCAGHAPSDTLGMNLLFDEIIPEDIQVCSGFGGFRRFSHRDENWYKR